ncbi:hypothetical protein E2C01_063219 [Portunus trituberculatus]|uniref:Uncharacterized protein n=1 Tax=Portunus trituberculatus TaxID=210409 RepID=A0A5B7HGG6_PORTR|nr:hypothetical protein [Portunus trituberculatus]
MGHRSWDGVGRGQKKG